MAANPYGTLGPSPGRVAKINKLTKKKKPVAKRPPVKSPPLRPPTRAAVNPIDARVNAEISPLMQALLFERNQKRDYNSRLMRDLGGFTNAVMGRLGGIAPQIGNAYAGARNSCGVTAWIMSR